MRKIFLVALAIAAALAGGAELYALGLVRFNYPSPLRFPVRGIDVSHHQAAIDWPAVAGTGVGFAYLKASEGKDHTDTRFAENWEQAGRAGLARGAYHFFTFCSPGEEQARHFLGVVAPLATEMRHAVDVEFSGNCRGWTSIDEIRHELRIFLRSVEAELGFAPVLYVTRRSHASIVRGHFEDYGLWVRDVLFEPSSHRYPHWTFWQYADNARVDGIEGPVDLNVYCCRELELLPSPPAAAAP